MRLLSSLRVRPDTLTVLGWTLSVVAAVLFGLGYVRVAGLVMLLGGLFDALDGAVARESNRMSAFGAFLDSTLDRLSEAAIFVGIIFYFAAAARPFEALLAGVAMTFSLLTSYARARAEGLDIDCEVGLLERAGRVVILSTSSLPGVLTAGLGLVAVGALVTTAQRIWHVRRQTREEPARLGRRENPPPGPAAPPTSTGRRSPTRSRVSSRRMKQAGYPAPLGDPPPASWWSWKNPSGPACCRRWSRSLETVGLPDAFVTYASTGLLAQEILSAEPHALVAVGPGAARDIDALDHPLARNAFSEPRERRLVLLDKGHGRPQPAPAAPSPHRRCRQTALLAGLPGPEAPRHLTGTNLTVR